MKTKNKFFLISLASISLSASILTPTIISVQNNKQTEINKINQEFNNTLEKSNNPSINVQPPMLIGGTVPRNQWFMHGFIDWNNNDRFKVGKDKNWQPFNNYKKTTWSFSELKQLSPNNSSLSKLDGLVEPSTITNNLLTNIMYSIKENVLLNPNITAWSDANLKNAISMCVGNIDNAESAFFIKDIVLKPQQKTITFYSTLKYPLIQVKDPFGSNNLFVWSDASEPGLLPNYHGVEFNITGVDILWDGPEYTTQVKPNFTLPASWANTLSQTVSLGQWITELKQALVDNHAVVNPTFINTAITKDDFNLEVVDFNNTSGSLDVNVVFDPNKYYHIAKPNTTVVKKPMHLDGFLKLNETVPISNLVLNDDINNKPNIKFASKITLNEIQNFINAKPLTAFVSNPVQLTPNQLKDNNWVKTTTIKAISAKANDIDGTILVTCEMDWYSDKKQIINNKKKNFTFTLKGYYSANNNSSLFNTKIPNPLKINASNTLSQDYHNNTNNIQGTINEEIKKQIVNQITGLNPHATKPLNQSITISNIRNYDNTNGSVEIDVTIANSNWWKNAVSVPTHTETIKIIGFKIVHSTQVDETWNVNRPTMSANQYTQQQAEADLKALQAQHIHNLVDNKSKVSIKILDPNSFVREGKVKVLITINPYYDANANYVDNSKQPYSKECYFVGFKSFGNSPEELTTGVRNGTIDGVSDILPQTITNNQLTKEQKDRILQGICNSQIYYYLVPGQTLTINDVDFIPATNNQPIQGNNINGSITVKIKIKNNKAWINGVIQQEWISPNAINIYGFKKIQATQKGTNIIDVSKIDPSLANRLAINFTKKEAEQLLNKNEVKKAIYINIPPNANINIDGNLDTNNASIGQISLNVNISSYYDKVDGYEQNGPTASLASTITLTGFKNGQGITTGFSGYVDCGTLLNNYYYSDINDPKKQTIIHDIIVNELINNQNKYFSNLNGTLTSNDIEIAIDYNKIDNTLGYLYLDSITIKNNKALENGKNVIGKYIAARNVKVVTLKTQLPSAWENKNDTSFVLNGGNKYFVKEIENNPSILTTLINNNADVLLRNPVKNIPISVLNNSIVYDYKNETITVTLGVSKFYNSKGIETTNDQNFSKFNHTYVFCGFKHYNQSMETNLKLTNIVWNEPIFKQIFGKNDKGFVIDWKQPNVLNEKQQQLLNFLNDPKNKNIVWLNPAPNTTVKSVTLSPISANNKVQANVVYSGLGNGFFDENLQATINIELRTMPTNSTDNAKYNIFNLIRIAINNFCQTNLRAPDDQEIINICVRVINKNKDQIANYYLPNNNGDVVSSSFIINKNTPSKTYIDRSIGSMYIYQAAIILNPNAKNELVFPDMGQYNWNEVVVDTRSEWEKWVKYVVFYSLIGLIIMAIIVLIIYLKRKKNSKNFDF